MIKSGSDQRFSSNHDQLLMKNQIFWSKNWKVWWKYLHKLLFCG